MLKFILLFSLTHTIFNFSAHAKSLESYKKDASQKCSKRFPKENYTSSFDNTLKLYYLYSCFPEKSIELIDINKNAWIIPELVKIPIKKKLNLKERLNIVEFLHPYIKRKSEKEKSLLNIIYLRRELNESVSKEMTLLYNKYPSHNVARKNMKTAKDFNRRGMNKQALNIYFSLLRREKRRYKKIKIYKEIVKTQKNIKRNTDYLKYSQNLVNLIYRQYRSRRSRSNRQSYLTHGLLNVRRIWTYGSTQVALDKLNSIIKYHCKRGFDCSEHYWIKGRILEEKLRYNDSLYWLSRAVSATPKRHKEYQNRLWNLSWLSFKHKGAEGATKVTLKNIKGLKEKEVGSKLYFWLSKWDEGNSQKYKTAIRKHHPLSFYLWGKLALNETMKLKSYSNKQIKKIAKKDYEKNLFKLYELQENSIARAYVKHTERRNKTFKRNISWKKLKALTGLYADLLLDLEAKNITPEENIFFFFSKGYKKEVEKAAREFKIQRNLLWSIIRQESNFDTYARSWADAFGLTQVLAKRAQQFNEAVENRKGETLNPFSLYEPQFNTRVGAWLIRENLKFFNKELPLTIAAYNASREKVNEWRSRFYKNDNWLHLVEEITYRETRKYVKLVSRNLEIYKALEN